MDTNTDTALKSHKFYGKGLYDPVRTDIRTVHYINKIYGPDILEQLTNETLEAKQLRRFYPEEAFSEDLVNTMRTRLVKMFPDSGYEKEMPENGGTLKAFQSVIDFSTKREPDESEEKKESENGIQRKRQKGDDFFLMLERGLFRNPEFRKIFKGPFSVYGWIWSNIVRKGWIDKKGYPIKERYYDRGLLAYCSSYRKIAKECFMDKDTVKKHIDFFASKGILTVDPIIPEGKKLPQNVYILGEWMKGENGKPDERLYLKTVLLSAKEGDLWDF